VYMSILSPFPTPHGAARGFFNSLLVSFGRFSGIWIELEMKLSRCSSSAHYSVNR
jgi:hypothetical protein